MLLEDEHFQVTRLDIVTSCGLEVDDCRDRDADVLMIGSGSPLHVQWEEKSRLQMASGAR